MTVSDRNICRKVFEVLRDGPAEMTRQQAFDKAMEVGTPDEWGTQSQQRVYDGMVEVYGDNWLEVKSPMGEQKYHKRDK